GHWTPIGERPDWTLLGRLLQAANLDERPSVLDVGCFDGAFLATLPAAWQRFGIEINPAASERAATMGITMLGRDLEDLSRIDRRFSAVCAIDVIEHVVDPRAFLRSLAAATEPGGVIAIASGATDARSWRLMRSRYWYCANPEHIAFINPEWCRRVAPQLGLELMSVTRYAHDVATLPVRLRQTAANVLYRFVPGLMRTLKKRFGALPPDESYLAGPPAWSTSRDHFIAVFRNP
ncbi:MAG: class I SAM-dependent methyltransferase, partial [Thermoanaerobaculia bacterium]